MANPVAVIVGGTRGIGLAMGKQWLRTHVKSNSLTPRLFILGRNVDTVKNQPLQSLIEEYNQCEIQPAMNLNAKVLIQQMCKQLIRNKHKLDKNKIIVDKLCFAIIIK